MFALLRNSEPTAHKSWDQVEKMLVKFDQIFCQIFSICFMHILMGKGVDGDGDKFKGKTYEKAAVT